MKGAEPSLTALEWVVLTGGATLGLTASLWWMFSDAARFNTAQSVMIGSGGLLMLLALGLSLWRRRQR